MNDDKLLLIYPASRKHVIQAGVSTVLDESFIEELIHHWLLWRHRARTLSHSG